MYETFFKSFFFLCMILGKTKIRNKLLNFFIHEVNKCTYKRTFQFISNIKSNSNNIPLNSISNLHLSILGSYFQQASKNKNADLCKMWHISLQTEDFTLNSSSNIEVISSVEASEKLNCTDIEVNVN